MNVIWEYRTSMLNSVMSIGIEPSSVLWNNVCYQDTKEKSRSKVPTSTSIRASAKTLF